MIMMPKTKKKMYEYYACDDGVYVYDYDGEVIGEYEGCGWYSYLTGETYLFDRLQGAEQPQQQVTSKRGAHVPLLNIM